MIIGDWNASVKERIKGNVVGEYGLGKRRINSRILYEKETSHYELMGGGTHGKHQEMITTWLCCSYSPFQEQIKIANTIL